MSLTVLWLGAGPCVSASCLREVGLRIKARAPWRARVAVRGVLALLCVGPGGFARRDWRYDRSISEASLHGEVHCTDLRAVRCSSLILLW